MCTDKKLILVVVVSYNGEKWMRKCLSSLQTSIYPIQVMVIDNGSKDNTIPIIKSEFQEIELVENHQNLGFGQANNIGLRKAIEQNFDFVFLLNQDAWIEEDTIGNLVDTIEQDKTIGILSPLHFTGSGKKLDQSFSRYIFQSSEFRQDYQEKTRDIKEVYIVPFVNAAAWLVSIECIQKIGGFDPIFFHYGEDQNYCQRVRYHGLKVGFSPYAAIFHDRENRDNTHTMPLLESSYVLVDLCDINNHQPNLIDDYISMRQSHIHSEPSNPLFAKQLEIALSKYDRIHESRRKNCLTNTNYLI